MDGTTWYLLIKVEIDSRECPSKRIILIQGYSQSGG